MNKNSKYLPMILGMVSFMMLASPALAQDNRGYGMIKRTEVKHTIANTAATTMASKRLAAVIAAGSKEIDNRVASLNKLSTRIQGMKNLSSDQINGFVNDINTNVTNLNNLKTKLTGDTDLATAQADRKSIFQTYRIYAVFEPRERILAQGDAILARINALKGKTTNTDALNKLSDATTQVNSAITTVSGLTPDGYPGNLSAIKTARTQLNAANKDIAAARKLMRQK